MEDNALYLSYARQYADADKLHLFYTNPFNDSGNYSPIYFQTQSILLALMMKTGISAGFLMIIFVILFSLLCFRLIIEIYDVLVSEGKYRTLGIILLHGAVDCLHYPVSLFILCGHLMGRIYLIECFS